MSGNLNNLYGQWQANQAQMSAQFAVNHAQTNAAIARTSGNSTQQLHAQQALNNANANLTIAQQNVQNDFV